MDITVQRLPTYVNQFLPTIYAEKPSLFRCGTASGAMSIDFAYPGHYDVYKLEHDLYVQLIGPDVASDQNGITPEETAKMFAEYHVGILDLMPLVQHGLDSGDYQPLHDEIEAENRQGVIQFLSVADESLLINDANGQSLHPNLHYGHCIVRLGFSDDQGYGLYFDPANPLACTDPANHKYVPVKIAWDSLVKAKVNFCYSIMPPGVAAPPADFRFTSGQWPKPKPTLDLTKAEGTIAAMIQAATALQTAGAALLQDLSALKEEV